MRVAPFAVMRSVAAAVSFVALFGCARLEDDAIDDAFDSGHEDGAIEDRSPLAYGVLGVASLASKIQLADGVGLTGRAVDNIAAARRGRQFGTLEELDMVSYVGPVALRKLATYAEREGWVEPVDGLAAQRAQELAKVIEGVAADNALTFAEADQIAAATMSHGLTLASLRSALEFFDGFEGTIEQGPDDIDAKWGGHSVLETLYFGMPRALTGMDGSGQTVTQSTTHHANQIFFTERDADPNRLVISGTANRSYQLRLWIDETRLVVNITAGSTAAATAEAIARAIKARAALIVESPWPQLDFESDTHLIGFSARASGPEVVIDPQLDS